jgi:hypothetical protein
MCLDGSAIITSKLNVTQSILRNTQLAINCTAVNEPEGSLLY